MTRAIGSVEMAHARLSARYGARADEIAWHRIFHLHDFHAVLDAARLSPLNAWLSGIGPGSTPHEIERVLRRQWRALVDEVATWMPEQWQRAVQWCAILADLAFVQHLARGGAVLPWMRNDEMLRTLVERDAEIRNPPENGGPYAPLASAWSDPAPVGVLWLTEWRRRMPAMRSEQRAGIADLVHALLRYFADTHQPGLSDTEPRRRALHARLMVLFRRAVLDPAEAFVFLALVALDLERLRGELVRRAAFPTLPILT